MFNKLVEHFVTLFEMPNITRQGKTVMSDNSLLKFAKLDEVMPNILFFRTPAPPPGSFSLFAEGYSLVYFMDSEQSAQDMKDGKIPYKIIPRGTFYSGGSPITDVWKKKFHEPGQEHILGLIEGNTMPDRIYIDMMAVRPEYRRSKINTFMIEAMQRDYPSARVDYSNPTDQGKKFIKSYTK